MKFKFFMPFACLCGLMTVATGCNNNDEVDLLSTPIRLSAFTEDEGGAKTRATTYAFPNEGKIYIKGAFIDNEEVDNDNLDWNTAKLYIQDIMATTSDVKEEGVAYRFNWPSNNKQYWPLPGTHMAGVDNNTDYKFLSFFAYSPEVDGTNFTLTTGTGDNKDEITFNMTLTALEDNVQTMPDVLYTYQGATASRAGNTVNLGKFCHALSQVQVVLNTTNVSPNVYIKELSIRLSKSGSFIHDGWLSENSEIDANNDPKYTYNGEANTITYYKYNDADVSLGGATKAIFLNSGMASTGTPFLVLPKDPHALVTLIYVDKTMGGEGVTKTNTWTVDKFLQKVEGGDPTPASLDRGKKTTLELTITGNEITTLTGKLEAWGAETIYETTID